MPFIFFLLLLPLITSGQEIAITFDDAPTWDGPLFSGEDRTRRIINALKEQRVNQVVFYVMTQGINKRSSARLHDYVQSGHLLANHSHSHRWMHEVGTNAFIKDIRTADSILRSHAGYIPYFRYPFLDEGRSVSRRDSIRAALEALGLSNGYVTVDNYDWYLNHLLRRAKEQNRRIDFKVLRQIYLDHIYNSILFYDKIARLHLGRSPRHVLLLHENDMAALFAGDLIAYLRQKGWKIISPLEAYQDAIASHVPDVLFNGQGRIAAIAREKGVPARELVQEAEDEAFLEKLTAELRAFE